METLSQQPHPDDTLYSSLAADTGLSDLVDQFVKELPARLTAMEERYSQGNWAELSRLSHQLKGAMGSYGFHQMTPVLLLLEQQARLAEDPVAIREALERVQADCRRVSSTSPGR